MNANDVLGGFLDKQRCSVVDGVHQSDPNGVWIHIAHIEEVWAKMRDVVAKARDMSNAAGIGVCGCSIVKAKQMDAALEGMRSALARLDEGVRP